MGLHPTFHIGLLNPYLRDSWFNRGTPSPQPDVVEDGHKEWERGAIVDHRPASRGREPSYLFKWVGFPHHENFCLPARQLGNTKALGRTSLLEHDFDTDKTIYRARVMHLF
jgi:hypothetical protein